MNRNQPHTLGEQLVEGKAVPALDGVRGAAILAVVLYHSRLDSRADWFAFPLGPVGVVGWVGVDLFFVLSGVLITSILLRTRGQDGYFKLFYVRRGLRIFPAYYLVMYLLASFPEYVIGAKHLDACQETRVWHWFYASNIRLLLDGSWSRCAINHFWSLATEEQFYLLWPLVIAFLGEAKLLRFLASAIGAVVLVRVVLVANGVSGVTVYVGPMSHVDALLVGALLAVLIRTEQGTHWLRLHARTVFVGALAVFFLVVLLAELNGAHYSVFNTGPIMLAWGLPLLVAALGSGMALLLVRGEGRFTGWLTIKPLLFLGRYSYGIYLVHPFVRRLLLRGLDFSRHSPLDRLTFVILVVVLSIAAAVLMWYLWEQPFLRLKRYFSYAKPQRSNAGGLAV